MILNRKRFANSPLIGNIVFYENGAMCMTTNTANSIWLGITDVAAQAQLAYQFEARLQGDLNGGLELLG